MVTKTSFAGRLAPTRSAEASKRERSDFMRDKEDSRVSRVSFERLRRKGGARRVEEMAPLEGSLRLKRFNDYFFSVISQGLWFSACGGGDFWILFFLLII